MQVEELGLVEALFGGMKDVPDRTTGDHNLVSLRQELAYSKNGEFNYILALDDKTHALNGYT